eukprot:11213970-Lingulodinium_polyedra.AAC.1
MMRLGVDDLLQRASGQGALIASYYAGIDNRFAAAVQSRWRYAQEHGLEAPRIRLARDIWGLLRRGAEALRA